MTDFFQGEQVFGVDLLEGQLYSDYLSRPGLLGERLNALPDGIRWVFIDEIQKIPALLDEVHRLLFAERFRFALTGSSARKLKRGGANLLAGRAFVYHLFPLTHREMGDSFELVETLHWGSLPGLLAFQSTEEKTRMLQAYTRSYIQEEVLAEQLVRGVEPFNRFLPVAGQVNGTILNFSRIARDVGIDSTTAREYFKILEDTLLGFFLEPFHLSIRKRQRTNPKFYLFDLGVARALQGTLSVDLLPGNYAFGKAFEHLVILEIIRLASYRNLEYRFSYLRTKDDAEVDLIVERPDLPIALVEIKSGELIDDPTVRKLEAFARTFENAECFVLCRERQPRRVGKIQVLPWQLGIEALGI